MASLEGLTTDTNVGQRAAAHATARLLDDGISLKFPPTPGEDELWVVLPLTHHQLDLASGDPSARPATDAWLQHPHV